MKIPIPIPLFPTYEKLVDFFHDDYPQISEFLQKGQSWRKEHWLWAADYLKYLGRNKSEHTYPQFRTNVERLLLWVFLFKNKPINDLRKRDILEFADFVWNPPPRWVNTKTSSRFVSKNGIFQVNPCWRPFAYRKVKGVKPRPQKCKYKPSQETPNHSFAAINSFITHLNHDGVCFGNPVPSAKRDCRYLIKDAQVKQVRRLTSEQWSYLLQTTKEQADISPDYERNLFVIASLKALFLRVSELSERPNWSPIMKHFWRDSDGNWWLKIYGKGRKIRDVTVPNSYLPYLARYRKYRGESELPSPSDDAPLVSKIRGYGGITSRHLARIVQDSFDIAYERMKSEKGDFAAVQLQEASSHWLRHTGASMEVERGRPLKDLSEDLGHSSMAITDTVYVQSENKRRAMSGKDRRV